MVKPAHVLSFVAVGLVVGLAAGCATSQSAGRATTPEALRTRLPDLASKLGSAQLTVVEFFSSDCPCQKAHDDRLRAMHDKYKDRGVQFIAVDSEVGATLEKDAAERTQRGYPFPLLTDTRGEWSAALGAEFATYVVVLDRSGAVHYRGGIDADHVQLRDDTTPWLGDAIAALLDGHEPPTTETEAFGCMIRGK